MENLEETAVKYVKHFCKMRGIPTRYSRDEMYIGTAISAILKARHEWKPDIGCKLSTFQYNGVRMSLLGLQHEELQCLSPNLASPKEFPIDLNKETVGYILEKVKLSQKHLDILEYKYYCGKNNTEIAKILKCSPQAIQKSLKRLLKILRQFVKENNVKL